MSTRIKKILIGVAIAVAVVAVGLLIYYFVTTHTGTFENYEVTGRQELSGDSGTTYVSFDGKVASFNQDGISLLTESGEVKWTAAYSMENPEASACGNYITVADIGSTGLVVYDENGTARSLTMTSPILSVSQSAEGFVAVLMQQGGDAYHIELLDPNAASSDAQVKAEILTYAANDGYALAIALSRDGTKLVTSYLGSVDNELRGTLTFYSFSAVGETAGADRIVGIYPYRDVIFPKVEFTDNDTVFAYGDSVISCFAFSRKPELIFQKSYDGRLLRSASDGGSVALLVRKSASTQAAANEQAAAETAETETTAVPSSDSIAKELAEAQEKEREELEQELEEVLENPMDEDIEPIDEEVYSQQAIMLYVLDRRGRLLSKTAIDFDVLGLQMNETDTILYSASRCVIIKKNGSVKFDGRFDEAVGSILAGSDTNRYFVVTGKYFEEIQLKK